MNKTNIFLLTICLISLCTTPSFSQQWIKSGDDFVADTTYINSLSSVCVDDLASTFVISLSNLALGPIPEEIYLTQAYTRTNGTLVELGQAILGDATEDPEVSASNLSADGKTLIIGRSSFDMDDNNLSGVIEIYELVSNQWVQKGDFIGGYGVAANFGASVDISQDGNTIIAGGDEGVFGGTGGYIRVFDWIDETWVQKGDSIRMDIPYTEFGSSVNISGSGDIIAVGAKGEFDITNDLFNAGSVTIFNWNGNNWVQMGQKFFGLNEMEDLGRASSFSLSQDGKRLVIGNRFSNDQEGMVEVFEWNESASTWTLLGNTLNGQYQQFGDGVTISGDGSTISVTGDYAIQMFNYNASINEWILIGNKIFEPTAYVGYGFLNYDGTILTAPGSIQIPEYTFLLTSLVRFYEFDENAVSNSNLNKEENIVVYPNPSSGEINIQSDMAFNRIVLSTILGEIVEDKKVNTNITSLELSIHPKGVYFVSVFDGSVLISQEKLLLL